MKKASILILSGLILLIIAGGSLFFYFFLTESGSRLVMEKALKYYLRTDKISIEKCSGDLLHMFSLSGLEIKDSAVLPPDSYVRIQRLDVKLFLRNLFSPRISIYNGKLQLAFSDPVLFYGSYRRGRWQATVYSKQLSVREMLDLVAERSILATVNGVIRNLDLKVRGKLWQPEISGSCLIASLSNDSFSIKESPVRTELRFLLKEKIRIFGELVFERGIVQGRRSAPITLQKSRIIFSGDPKMPKFDIKGHAKIGEVRVFVLLQGTRINPDLKLTSNPALPEDQILIMLATNKSWAGTRQAIKTEKISPDIASDFLEYFLLAGSGNKFASRLGLRDISFKYDNSSKGFGLVTSAIKGVDLGYQYEQPQVSTDGKSQATHKVSTEYKITNDISLDAERKVTQEDQGSKKKDVNVEDKVLLKVKKDF